MTDVNSSLDKLAVSTGGVVADADKAASVLKAIKAKPTVNTVLDQGDVALGVIKDVEQSVADARQATADVKAAVAADPTMKISKLKLVGEWVTARLSEKSTWSALITVGATLLGVAVSPEHAETIATLGTLVSSGILSVVVTKF